MQQFVTKIIEYQAAEFSFEFLRELENLKKSLKKFGIDIDEMIPEVFNGENLRIDFVYSFENANVLITFNNPSGKQRLSGTILNTYFTSTNVFAPFGGGINFGGGEVVLKNCKINNHQIDYGVAMSYEKMAEKIKNIRAYVSDFASFYWVPSNTENREELIKDLSFLAYKMKELFFDETVSELEIDNFLEKNPVILQRTMHLIPINNQAILKNVLNKYEHDLKPDLIAFDELEKRWVVVDYKRAKRSILKNIGKVREGFKAEVHSLEDQLRDYIEYFDEHEHREFYRRAYGRSIEHPKGIGIIGNVGEEFQTSFNRLLNDKPRWFGVMPYNYIYDSFNNYIDMLKREFNFH